MSPLWLVFSATLGAALAAAAIRLIEGRWPFWFVGRDFDLWVAAFGVCAVLALEFAFVPTIDAMSYYGERLSSLLSLKHLATVAAAGAVVGAYVARRAYRTRIPPKVLALHNVIAAAGGSTPEPSFLRAAARGLWKDRGADLERLGEIAVELERLRAAIDGVRAKLRRFEEAKIPPPEDLVDSERTLSEELMAIEERYAPLRDELVEDLRARYLEIGRRKLYDEPSGQLPRKVRAVKVAAAAT